jgi:hypothetical protein
MREELITFETAKLAKEKGLSGIRTIEYYNNGKLYSGAWDDGKLDWNGEPHDNMGDLTKYCSAPTQSLLQKWLREKHNLFYGAMPIYTGIYFRPTRLDCSIINLGTYHTYEEALEVALQEALKLIEL